MSFTAINTHQSTTQVDKWVARLLMVSFFLGIKGQAIGVVACIGYFFFKSIFERHPISMSHIKWALVMGSGFFLYLIALPLTPQAFSDKMHLVVEGRLSYLLFPILVGLTARKYINVLVSEFRFFVFAAVATCIYANTWFVTHFYLLHHDQGQVINHVTYRIFFETVTQTHPTYISMYISAAIFMLLTGITQLNKLVSSLLGYLLLAFLLAILAKSPVLAVGIAALHFAWEQRGKIAQYKWAIVGLVAVIAMSYLFVPFVSQRVNELITVGGGKSHNPVADNSLNERKLIWEVDKSALSQFWKTGCGPGKLMYELKLRYFFNSMTYKTNIGLFDPHSQYFYECISFGVLGVVFLLIGFGTHIIRALKSGNKFYAYLLLLFGITFFTESLLVRQQGLLFYAFFTSVMFFYTLTSHQRKSLR